MLSKTVSQLTSPRQRLALHLFPAIFQCLQLLLVCVSIDILEVCGVLECILAVSVYLYKCAHKYIRNSVHEILTTGVCICIRILSRRPGVPFQPLSSAGKKKEPFIDWSAHSSTSLISTTLTTEVLICCLLQVT